MLQNVDWENDALTIVFGNTKSDIEGESTADKKRLYANPFLPEICVILSFAMLTSDAGPLANSSNGMNAIVDRLNNINNGSVQIQSQEANHQQLPIMTTGRIHFWPGDDRMHHVPQGFKWPMGKNTMVIWNYWFFGEAVRGIGPYKFIPPSDDLTTK